MNASQISAYNDRLEQAVEKIQSLLFVDKLKYNTINQPVPTLHAFMSIILATIDLIPEIHQSPYQHKLRNIAEKFLTYSRTNFGSQIAE